MENDREPQTAYEAGLIIGELRAKLVRNSSPCKIYGETPISNTLSTSQDVMFRCYRRCVETPSVILAGPGGLCTSAQCWPRLSIARRSFTPDCLPPIIDYF